MRTVKGMGSCDAVPKGESKGGGEGAAEIMSGGCSTMMMKGAING
jgi:hypothetical protein